MFGRRKVMESSFPERDVFGDFNGPMADAYIVVLDELSKKQTSQSEGRIKALVTAPTIMINQKGQAQYEIDSHHKFIVTTNDDDPVKVTTDNRRMVVMRCSDELILGRGADHFARFRSLLGDKHRIKRIFDYFNSPDRMCASIPTDPIPTNRHSESLVSENQNYLEMFLENLCDRDESTDHLELKGEDLYTEYVSFLDKNKIELKINALKFGCQLARTVVPGIVTCGRLGQGTKRALNLVQMRAYFRND